MDSSANIRNALSAKGLKVTPQRVRILEAIYKLNNHPTAEQVLTYIRKQDPNIGAGTVYNVLDTLVKNNIIKRVKTEKEAMRYDGIIENHHHLYCKECDFIEDYTNEKLDELLSKFFEENKIENFIVDEIKLQIGGNFIIHKSKNQ